MNTKRAAMIAIDLMAHHGLSQWDFELRPMKRSYGYCHHSKKLIVLSSLLTALNSEEQTIDTIQHEIAHALAPTHAGHGRDWKLQAKLIGCRPVRCYTRTVTQPARKYQGQCPKCRRVILAHRRRKVSCGVCNPKFDKSLLFVWSEVNRGLSQ